MLFGNRPVETRVVSGALRGSKFVLNRADQTKMWLGIYERAVQRSLQNLSAGARLAFDVGAYAGYFTVLMERCGARVIALEPDPDNAAALRRNLTLNHSTAEVLEVAASDVDGTGFIEHGPGSMQHRLAKTGRPTRTVRLDSLADAYGVPDVVKVDVEGAELLALAGAENLLRHGVSFVLETHGEAARREAIAIFERHLYLVGTADNSLVAVRSRTR